MKNLLIISLFALGATACSTYNRTPDTGGMGEYGFTYDLEGSPSPFADTRYRPLTSRDLATPVIIRVTNQAPPRIIYENGPETGVTRPSGTAPLVASGVAPQNTIIYEGAGADRGAANAPAGAAPGYAPGGPSYGAPGFLFFDSNTNGADTNRSLTLANTNNFVGFTNLVQTNINGTNFLVFNETNFMAFNGTNFTFNGTNFIGFTFNGTNFAFNGTNFTVTTNGFINEAAGSQLSNSFNDPLIRKGPQPIRSQSNNVSSVTNVVPPPQNRALFNVRTNQAVIPNQNTVTPQNPAANQNQINQNQLQNQNQNQNTITAPNTGNTVTRPQAPPPSPPLVQPR